MFRFPLTNAIIAACLVFGAPTARADDLDSLINLELAFRDTILQTPAPKRFQQLIRDGETTITFVDDFSDSVGKTDFFLNLDWSFKYRYKTQTTDSVTSVLVTPENVKLQPRVRHVIRMPVALYNAQVWESHLLAHEFDHVAISLDPRPRALLVHLCGNLPTYQFPTNGSEKPSDQQMRERINNDIKSRESAVLDLLRANYVALDKVSKHGGVAIQDRRAFFASLYSRSNLEATKFAYLREVASLLESDQYRDLRPRQVPKGR